jgi:hypothetical protein
MNDRANLAPADELFAVRTERKRLMEREDELRAILLADPAARTGNAYVASVKEIETFRTDVKALKEVYPEAYDAVTFPDRVTRVVLNAISEDGEILPIRRTKGVMA